MTDKHNKMEISEKELLMMMTEFWSLDNNDVCEKATQIFLKRSGLSHFINKHPRVREWDKNITEEDENNYLETLEGYEL